MAEPMKAEGCYQDPFGRHQDRWYSDGAPTALVRDGEVEANDAPPSTEPPSGPLVRSVPADASAGSDDLRRADAAEADDNPDYSKKAFDVIGEFIRPRL